MKMPLVGSKVIVFCLMESIMDNVTRPVTKFAVRPSFHPWNSICLIGKF
jgi:hypothetical protein